MLAINGGEPVIKNIDDAKFIWPDIDKEIEDAVRNQLHETISIYDRSGIIKKFEDDFKNYHNIEFGLLTNSGTNAIYSMFAAAGLSQGDEVICPAYTFFATVTPLLFTGAIPVLCDCQEDGNIDHREIEKLITPKTKGLIVTHMWGIPCEMDPILEICKKHNLLLFEDCSHAHGATYHDQVVGTFGNAAAWSLQGQKIITGGEGGIMLTKDKEIYYKGLLIGHYNKRCRQEIPKDHPLSKYSLTGMGLKLRSHPLAIVIADVYFKRLDEYLKQKRYFADKFSRELSKLKGLRIPAGPKDSQPSWYAYIIEYVPEELRDLPRNVFVDALHKEGLIEVDTPDSTCPLNQLPLFQDPGPLFPDYKNKFAYSPDGFPKARTFYKNAIKLPIWFKEENEETVDLYIEGFKKVIENHKSLL
ncbi:DegT/DnrJ/EryC1/StrS family aminotransferase [Patescibacteria group bacterium]|nr:DegT/DnrJ/EryC1/StrS family aminotransferase [Patescibacteria group bacterium]